jgi:hypothetical protein
VENKKVEYFRLKKGILGTILIYCFYLVFLVLGSCVDQLDSDPFGSCPGARKANAVDLKVFYSPYSESRFSTESDTVDFKDFSINFELIPELETEGSLGNFPGNAFALSCAVSYNFQNISNMSVTLLAPFNGLSIGTDISYLFQIDQETTLNKLRVFDNHMPIFGAKLNLTPTDYDQLKTRTFLFLKDGSKIVVDSTSPYLKIN